MRARTDAIIWGVVMLASVGAHAVAFGGLGGARTDGFGRPAKKRPTTVEMSVAKPKETPPPPPAPTPVTKPQPRVAVARPAAPKAPAAEAVPPPAPAAAPPPEEAPADFTGVTMTNDSADGAGWASATGNGQVMNGPVGRPGARVTRRVVDGDGKSDGQAHARRTGPPVVGLGDLSAPPTAPDLTDALAAAYPDDARSKGLTGKAVVRARVMPDGSVGELALVSESGPGFGDACQQTLRQSHWSPPLDRQARPVSTFINYTCRFNVQ